MSNLERSTVKLVAKIAPWLAPLPSAFFVARSGMEHLGLPLALAVVAAAIIETLGLTTVHTALWLADWNRSKRQIDPSAPVALAVALGLVYLVATLGLVVFLEVWPFLATYAPALFPLLAIVGAVNLALIAQQERRESQVKAQKAEARERRRLSKKVSTGVSRVSKKMSTPEQLTDGELSIELSKWEAKDTKKQDKQAFSELRHLVWLRDGKRCVKCGKPVEGMHYHCHHRQLESMGGRGKPSNLETLCGSCHENLHRFEDPRKERKARMLDTLLDIYRDDPEAGATDIARRLGIGRSTVYHYQGELEAAGRIKSNGNGIEVL